MFDTYIYLWSHRCKQKFFFLISVYILYYYGINSCRGQENEKIIIDCLPLEELWY